MSITIKTDSTDPRQITFFSESPESVFDPDWSWSTNQIAVSASIGTYGRWIWLISPDGEVLNGVCISQMREPRLPRWSLNGQHLTVSAGDSRDSGSSSHLWTMESSGIAAVNLTLGQYVGAYWKYSDWGSPPYCPSEMGSGVPGVLSPLCQPELGIGITKTSSDLSEGSEDVYDDPTINPVSAGESVTFTITVSNTSGINAYDIDILDPFPSDFLYTTLTLSVGTYDLNSHIWSIPSLPTSDEQNTGEAVLTVVGQVTPHNLSTQ